MRTDKKIRDEKLQWNINRQAAKISVLSSGKNDKFEYLTGKEILPTDQSKVKEETKFSCWPLGKAFEKQTKKTDDWGRKQIEALKVSMSAEQQQKLKSIEDTKDQQNDEIKKN